MADVGALLERVQVARDKGALARLISLVERSLADESLDEVGFDGPAPEEDGYAVAGFTGAPGAGKSTLVDRMIGAIRAREEEVAVLAVDPSSPFSGGAILGDRIRMQSHTSDPGVYIRSLATRGHLGGLSIAVPEVVRLLQRVGYPWILVETVGVGQVEVEVVGEADITVVVLNPGWGDSVQASKAGLMEAADVFVINKADRPGLRETKRDLETMLDIGGSPNPPPIIETVATSGDGVARLLDTLVGMRSEMAASGELARRRGERRVRELERLVQLGWGRVLARVPIATSIRERVGAGTVTPRAGARELLREMLLVGAESEG